jgi:hypothetical protein
MSDGLIPLLNSIFSIIEFSCGTRFFVSSKWIFIQISCTRRKRVSSTWKRCASELDFQPSFQARTSSERTSSRICFRSSLRAGSKCGSGSAGGPLSTAKISSRFTLSAADGMFSLSQLNDFSKFYRTYNTCTSPGSMKLAVIRTMIFASSTAFPTS